MLAHLCQTKGKVQMQRTFFLRGLAEGITGVSTVLAVSVKEVFVLFPSLAAVKDKLTIDGNTIKGFAPCDG